MVRTWKNSWRELSWSPAKSAWRHGGSIGSLGGTGSRCYPAIDKAAAVVDTIAAQSEPFYGINTGFGKLANVQIGAADLSQLQRNLVMLHAAGVGEAMPRPVVRLMMALKIRASRTAPPASVWKPLAGLKPCWRAT